MRPFYDDPWLYLSITARHHKVVKDLNDDHWYDSNSPPSRGSTPFHDDDDADLDDGTVVYSLRIKEIPEYVFGTNATVDFRLDEPTPSSLLSDYQFKVYYNENRAWIFHDLSKNGTILNGKAMCSSKRQSKLAERGKKVEVLDRLALRPDVWNDIDTLAWKLRIRVGHIQPKHIFDSGQIDLSQLRVEYQSTMSARSEISEEVWKLDSLLDRYYLLEQESEPMTKLSLMRLTDGKRHLGHLHDLKKSHVRENYQRCLELGSMAHLYDVLPYVDADVLENSFVTVTEAWDGDLVEKAFLDVKDISFLFAKLLRSIAFLHDQGFACKISSDNILVKQTGRYEGKLSRHGLPIMTNVYIDLDHQIHPVTLEAKNANMRALGCLITGCLDEIEVKWQSTPIGQHLQACLFATQQTEQHLAHSLLVAMKIKRSEDLLWPFQASIQTRRIFPLFWQRGQVRLKEIHDIIRACGTPRTPLIAPTSSIDGENFLDSKTANKLLRRHAIPGQLQQKTFCYTRNIFRHNASGLYNISQVLDICADWPLPKDFQTPATIQEVRGSGEWDGFYIDKANFDSVIVHLRNCCSLTVIANFDSEVEHIGSDFESIDHQSCVAIFTECSTPQLVQLTREVRSGVPLANQQFPNVEECYSWFIQSGLIVQAEGIRNLKQPFQVDWKQVGVVGTTDSRLSESPYSPTKFRFGKHKSRSLSSHNEAFTRSSKLSVSQQILSWQETVSHVEYDSDNSQASTVRLCEDEQRINNKASATELKPDHSSERKKSKTGVDIIPSAQQEHDVETDEDFVHDTIEPSQYQRRGRYRKLESEVDETKMSNKLSTTNDRTMRPSHRLKSRRRKADDIDAFSRPVSLTRGRIW